MIGMRAWAYLLIRGSGPLLAGIVLLIAAAPVIGWVKFEQTKVFFDLLGGVQGNTASLAAIALILMIVQLAELAAGRLRSYIQEIYMMRVSHQLDHYLLGVTSAIHTITKLESPRYKDDFYLLKNNIAHAGQLIGTTIDMLHQLVMVAVYVYLVSHYSWMVVGVAFAASIPGLMFTIGEAKRTLAHQAVHSQASMESRNILALLFNPYAQKELILYAYRKVLSAKWDRLNRVLIAAKRRLLTKNMAWGFGMDIISPAGYFVIQIILLFRVTGNAMSIGDYMAVSTTALSLVGALKTFWILSGSNKKVLLFRKQLADFIHQYVTDHGEQQDELVEPIHSIELRDLSFAYPARSRQTLANIRLYMQAGEFIVLVGENGSGKSTLAKIIAGLHEVPDHVLMINNQDINRLSRKSVYEQIALVNQDFNRYPLSGYENIAMRDDYEKQDIDALLGEYPMLLTGELKHELDAVLGNDYLGARELSGGQWQRFAVARALYKQCSLLILDEPTSEIDPVTEMALIDMIRKKHASGILVLVTHNLKLAVNADRIIVMDQGVVIEQGSHAALMRQQGKYAEMWEANREEGSVSHEVIHT